MPKCGCFCVLQVTDMMLQEKLYPNWAVGARRWWTTGYRRIILFWTITTVATFIVVFVIATDYIQWDKLNRDFLHSNEASRAFLASFILVMDIFIVLQVRRCSQIVVVMKKIGLWFLWNRNIVNVLKQILSVRLAIGW